MSAEKFEAVDISDAMGALRTQKMQASLESYLAAARPQTWAGKVAYEQLRHHVLRGAVWAWIDEAETADSPDIGELRNTLARLGANRPGENDD